MIAQPVPPADQQATAHTALANLRAYGPQQFRARGAHALAKQLDWLLQHVPELEARLAFSERQRREYEASAEGEFYELRVQVRAWQTYAAQLEERRNALAGELRALLGSLQRLANSRWWRRRERREAREDVSDGRIIAARTLAQDEPTPPLVDLDG